MLQLKVDRLNQTVAELDVEVRRMAEQRDSVTELLKEENARLKNDNLQLEGRVEYVARELDKLAVSER